ncbi:MAG TPA: AI-2E family transporter [Puia sp.]|nr:AI-2E family transporter [Puia sp.]
MASSKQSAPFYTRLAMVLISLISLFYIAIAGKEVLAPLLFALLFSVLLLPLANFLERRLKLPRSLAALSSVLLLLLSIAAVLYLVGSQISSLANDWPLFKKQVSSSLQDVQHWISQTFHVEVEDQMNYVENTTSHILSTGPAVIGGAVLSVSSLLLFLAFTMIDTFFLLYYRRLLVRFLVAVFKEDNSVTVYEIIAQVQTRIRQYILGLLLEMIIVSSASCLGLWIIGVRYSILLGLLAGLLNFVPYIGIFIALLLSTLVTFATAGVAKLLWVIFTLLGIHLVDANVLLPMIVGSKVKVNGLITILGVIIGGSAWGITGAFLALPVIAIIKIVFDRIEPLKPWGMLLGDEIDEKQPEPLKEEIKEEGAQNGNTTHNQSATNP